MNLNYNALVREARTRAANRGLNLKFEKQFKPRTDGRTMYIQEPHPAWNDKQWAVWWTSYEHELGHNDPDMVDIFDVIKDIDTQSFLGAVLNILDDHRQEHHKNDEYLGRKRRLEEGHRVFAEAATQAKYGQSGNKYQDAIETLCAYDTIIREEWMPSLSGLGDQIADTLNDTQKEHLEKLLASDFESTLKSGISAWEELDLAKQMIATMGFDPEEEEENAKRDPKECSNPGDGTKGEGNQSGDGGGDSEPSDEEGEEADGDGTGKAKSGDDGEDSDSKAEAAKVKYSDILKHSHSASRKDSTYGTHVAIEYDTETGRFSPADMGKHIVWDHSKGGIELHPRAQCERKINEIINDTTLHKRVRRLLQTKVTTKYQHALKRGKLSSKSVYRAGVKNSGEYQKKVFKKKQVHNELDVVFSIVMDCSGSMRWRNKYEHAGASVIMFNEALRALNIPVEIIGFDEQSGRPRQALWKVFQKPVTKEELAARIADSNNRQMYQNSDGESVLWAYDRLARQKAARKIMIVLSDGSPCSDRSGDADWYTRTVVDNIQKGGNVEIYGIGIMDNNVERIYKHHRVISSADELEDAVLDVIKEKVINI